MSRIGTCRWCYQIQEMWRIVHDGLDYSHPHTPSRRETHVVLPEGEYTCQWLDCAGPLPPPVARRHGGLDVRAGDCDACDRYEPVSIKIPGVK